MFRKQDEMKLGHTCFVQSEGADRIASRSPLGNTATSLASTMGTKPGNAITAAPRSAKIPKAANDFIIWAAVLDRLNPSTRGDQVKNN